MMSLPPAIINLVFIVKKHLRLVPVDDAALVSGFHAKPCSGRVMRHFAHAFASYVVALVGVGGWCGWVGVGGLVWVVVAFVAGVVDCRLWEVVAWALSSFTFVYFLVPDAIGHMCVRCRYSYFFHEVICACLEAVHALWMQCKASDNTLTVMQFKDAVLARLPALLSSAFRKPTLTVLQFRTALFKAARVHVES